MIVNIFLLIFFYTICVYAHDKEVVKRVLDPHLARETL